MSEHPMAGHQEFKMFDINKSKLVETPAQQVLGTATTPIQMSQLHTAIQNPSEHRMVYSSIPEIAHEFYKSVSSDFVSLQMTKFEAQYQNEAAKKSLATFASEGKIPQKCTQKAKPISLGKGALQEEEAAILNTKLEAIAAEASKQILAQLQASRAKLGEKVKEFNPRKEIHDIAQESYENMSGGRGSRNFLDCTYHAVDDLDRNWYISDTLYSMALYDGMVIAQKKQAEIEAKANAKKLQKEEEERKRTAADAIMNSADAGQDEKSLLEKFKELLTAQEERHRSEIEALKKQVFQKNRGGGQAARGGHQQHTAPQTQGRGRGRGRGQQAPQDPNAPRGGSHGRGRGRGRSQSRPSSRPSSRSSSRPTSRPASRAASRSASPSGSTSRNQSSSSNQETHRPWFAAQNRFIVQTRLPAEPRGGGQGRGQAQRQHHPQQNQRGRGRGLGRGQPRSRSRSASSDGSQNRRSRSREDGSPRGRGNGRGNPAQRGRDRGRGRGQAARGGRQSPRLQNP
mmetsp:Transcript_60095/g.125733  ORF Transcript_60095/g.125733 Transcript_60095/m.125733 type:complete len:513 (+) Transcript_60095:2974-4512(+)